jgi:predicted tellurium resistance membrane protein TerC
MNASTKRTIARWVHLIFGIPILGYIYSPFEELPNYAPIVRYAAAPAVLLTGLLMWKGDALRRLFTRS